MEVKASIQILAIFNQFVLLIILLLYLKIVEYSAFKHAIKCGKI